MGAKTEIISCEEVRELALKTATFDDALIEDYILPAQRQYLRPFLGDDFYDEILDQAENVGTLTADNNTLIDDYLKPMLAYYIVYDAFPSIAVNITSRGIMVNESETSVAASSSTQSMLRQNYLSMGERWEKDADKFIKDQQEADSTKYPDYCPKSNFNNKSMFVI